MYCVELLEYIRLVWPSTRDVSRCPQGSPRALASAGRRRGQRSNLLGGARWRDGYRFCGTCEGAAGPGRAKTSSPGRKTVLGPSCGGAGKEGVETSGSENETRLVAAELPGCEPGSLPRRRRLPGMASAAVQALRRLTAMTSSRASTRMVKERSSRRRTV